MNITYFLRRFGLTLVLVVLSFTVVITTGFAQGTILSVEEAELSEGETASLFIILTEALDGLGRLDATLTSSNPEVVSLNSISPEAVSEQFLQIDSESDDGIKFKLVDLGKKVDPGDTDVKLLSFEVETGKAGKAELSLADVKYTDEDGNVIEPEVNSAEITVKSPEAEEEEAETKEEETNGKGEEDVPEQEPEGEEKEEDEEEEKEKQGEASTTEKDYIPEIKDIKVKLGETKKVHLDISSLPDGLRVARVAVTSTGGVTFDSIEILNPSFYEIVDRSDKLLSFQVGDFDREVQPETENLNLAEIGVKALKVGKTNIEAKLTVWTDKGEVVRETRSMTLSVDVGVIGNSSAPAKDLDGDGLYEDVNGDGKVTKSDAFVLAFNLETETVRNNSDLFDFNRDGKVTFDDAVELIKSLE